MSQLTSIRQGDGDRLLVLLHGLGSNEEDLITLAPEVAPDWLAVSFRAPLSYGGGFSWFPLDVSAEGVVYDEAGAAESIALLGDEFNELRSSFREMVVLGFSQGAFMAAGAMIRSPESFAGTALLSGGRFPSFFADAQPAPVGAGPVLIQHGLFDPVLPVELGRTLSESLADLGYSVTYREYPMGHQVSPESLADLKAWLGGV